MGLSAMVFIAVKETLRVMLRGKLGKGLPNELVSSREGNVMDFPRLA